MALTWDALTLVLTGTVVNVVGQYLAGTGFAKPASQIIPWVRYCSTFLYALVMRTIGPRDSGPGLSGRQQTLLTLIGLLDTVAYILFTLGFYALGPAAAGLILAASSQILTAAASHFVLKHRLSGQQVLALTVIVAGLAVRYGDPGSTQTSQHQSPVSSFIGTISLLGAAALYASMGIVYSALHSVTDRPPPTYAEISWHSSKIGFGLTSAYLLLYTYPRRATLLSLPNTWSLSPKLLAFMLSMNGHMACQSRVFKSSGPMGVALANALRGAVLTLVTAGLFCTPEKPWLCLHVHSFLSVVVTLFGGFLWSIATEGPRKKQAVEQGGDACKIDLNGIDKGIQVKKAAAKCD